MICQNKTKKNKTKQHKKIEMQMKKYFQQNKTPNKQHKTTKQQLHKNEHRHYYLPHLRFRRNLFHRMQSCTLRVLFEQNFQMFSLSQALVAK
jgi:hypothetical protein